MGKTHRASNISITKRRSKLLLDMDIKLGKGNDLAFVPDKYISISEATRKFNLSDDDLLDLKSTAVVATKYGQEGIFYPVEKIESLQSSKINPVTPDMLPENLIRRQLPREFKTDGMFERLRPFASTWDLPGHVGTREGHKGRPTYFYKKEVLKEELGLEVISRDMEEGVDYLEMSSVFEEVREELPYPPLAINAAIPSERAKRCYFREQVEYVGTRWSKRLPRKSSRNVKQNTLETTAGSASCQITLGNQPECYSELSTSQCSSGTKVCQNISTGPGSQCSSERESTRSLCSPIYETPQSSQWSNEGHSSHNSSGTQEYQSSSSGQLRFCHEFQLSADESLPELNCESDGSCIGL